MRVSDRGEISPRQVLGGVESGVIAKLDDKVEAVVLASLPTLSILSIFVADAMQACAVTCSLGVSLLNAATFPRFVLSTNGRRVVTGVRPAPFEPGVIDVAETELSKPLDSVEAVALAKLVILAIFVGAALQTCIAACSFGVCLLSSRCQHVFTGERPT